MSRPVRSTRNPTPIYNPYAREPRTQTFSSYYEPKPRPSAYGDVDGYYSDDMDDDVSSTCELCGNSFGHKIIIGLNNKRYCSDDCMDNDCYSDCSSNCSAHDVTEEEVINWMIEDGQIQAQEEQVQAPVRRSARIAHRAQKYGPTSYVGMDSVEPEGEGDFITDIWYDYSVHYDSDYESPEQIKERKEKERQAKRDAWWQRFFERRRAKHAEEEAKEARKAMKKELAKAKKANEQMNMDIQEQIVEDISKLTLDTTKLTDEEYFQILKLKQNTDQVLTWKELNFVTDYAISQMKQEQKESSLDTKPQHNNDNDNDNDNDNLRCSNLISKQHNGQQLSWDELCFVVRHKLTYDGYYNLLKSKQRNCQVLTRDELETMVWSFRY